MGSGNMIEYQRLFLVQARSTFKIFELLCDQSNVAPCHVLHHFQMATELLGKAHSWKHNSPNVTSHRAFVGFLRSLSTNRKAQKQLGFEGKNDSWNQMIQKSL